VPEFEHALFDTDRLGALPDLVTTRFGFHVVLVARPRGVRARPGVSALF